MAVSSWTAIPDDAFDQAVKAKVRDSSNGANIIVLVSLYRIARQAIKLGEYEVDADGNMWFDAGLRLISSYSGVSHNHVSEVTRKLQNDRLIRVCKSRNRGPVILLYCIALVYRFPINCIAQVVTQRTRYIVVRTLKVLLLH